MSKHLETPKTSLEIYSMMSSEIKVSRVETTSNKAIIEIKGLRKGMGSTVGNSVRRSLYLIPSLRSDYYCFEGVYHQFSELDGVVEDLIQISENIKSLSFKISENFNYQSISKSDLVCSLDINSVCKKFKASDIILPDGLSVVDTDLHLFESIKPMQKFIKIYLKYGFGVEIACQEGSVANPGAIYVNKFFSPVVRASIDVVDDIHNGDSKNFEKLTFEIETDGSVSAIDSFDSACGINSGVMKSISRVTSAIFNAIESQINEYPSTSQQSGVVFNDSLLTQSGTPSSSNKAQKADDLISHIEFSVRTMNCLKQMSNVRYISDLESFSARDLLSKKNFGKKSLNEVQQKMQERGFSLRSDIEDSF